LLTLVSWNHCLNHRTIRKTFCSDYQIGEWQSNWDFEIHLWSYLFSPHIPLWRWRPWKEDQREEDGWDLEKRNQTWRLHWCGKRRSEGQVLVKSRSSWDHWGLRGRLILLKIWERSCKLWQISWQMEFWYRIAQYLLLRKRLEVRTQNRRWDWRLW